LTTHNMEEASHCCGRIGIMTKGKLQSLGSVQHLKNKFGQGYHLHLTTIDEASVPAVRQFVQATFPGSFIIEEYGKYMAVALGSIASLAKAFDVMVKNKSRLNLADYSIGQTSLEQVFLFFAKQQEAHDLAKAEKEKEKK